MASTYLSKTFSAGNQKTWTWSFWTKIPNYDASNNKAIFSGYNDANNLLKIQFTNTDQFQSYGLSGGTLVCRLVTNQLFRDYNGWYHIVYSLDTTQATSTDRQKLWVNGEEITSFSTRTDPSQNADLQINNTIGHQIGAVNNADHYSNCMGHCHFIDGTRYDASYFGETDATTGIWKPKTAPSVTYGTNGFFLKFENSGSMGTDSSGNGNNFTVGAGTLTQTIDTPTHNFCTLNPLIPHGANLTFSNGNLSLATSSSQWQGALASIAPNGGKYYFEAKYNTGTGIKLDIARADADIRNMTVTNTSYLSYSSLGYGYQLNNTGYDYYCNNNSCTTWTTNRGNSTKIIMVALDIDNGKMWVGDNGTWYNKSGTANPETGADPLHDFSSDLNGENWFINMSCEGSGTAHNLNFGGGFFGTTAVSSAGTNASGIGTFEYDVPSGYTALTSKGLNE